MVYGERNTNRDVYEQTVRKVAMGSLEGISGTVFVYGQTGTGKTYTMMGHQRTQDEDIQHGAKVSTQLYDKNGAIVSARQKNLYETYENSGVLIFAMQDIFNKIQEIQITQQNFKRAIRFQIKVSYIEIYNEMIYDLLAIQKENLSELTIHESKNKEFFVKGATEIEVDSMQEVLELINLGENNRHYAETYHNHCSSRSHTLFRLQVCYFQQSAQNKHIFTSSYLNFVDLAGSERIANYVGGKEAGPAEFNQSTRLKEGLSINKSLFYLTQVIHMLSQRSSQHIPYRNSTLTKILRSSLGGNSKTTIIVCVTPASSQIEQTMSSLKFGQKAMKIQQTAKIQMSEMKNNSLMNR